MRFRGDERLEVAVPGAGVLRIRRPTFAEFDAALAVRLAQVNGVPRAAAELARLVAGALDAIAERDEVLEGVLARLREGDVDLAVEVADAICDALALTPAMRGEVLRAAGARFAGCREHVQAEGEPARAWAEGEARPDCEYDCPPGCCVLELGPSIAAEVVVRDWKLCGGVRRSCWPRPGGLGDQDASVVYWFMILDGFAAAQLAAATQPQQGR